MPGGGGPPLEVLEGNKTPGESVSPGGVGTATSNTWKLGECYRCLVKRSFASHTSNMAIPGSKPVSL